MYILGGVVLLCGLWAAGSYAVIYKLEEPTYQVIETNDDYEVRTYAPYIVAETTVEGGYRDALEAGFRNVADYIFGNNTTQASIAMTTPVLEASSREIAMTTPVLSTETEAAQTRTIAFVLPSEYTLDTLPTPNNPAVTLREVPGQTMAALRFTWYATEGRIEKKKAALLAALLADGKVPVGLPQVAQYNPPLSMPLILRNEILIPIETPKQGE